MISRRGTLTALVLLAAGAAAAPMPVARAARPSELVVSWERDKTNPHWVHGQVDVATAPPKVWARLQNVQDWPQVFTDIKWIKIKERRENRFVVRLETRTFTCGSHDYVITLDPPKLRGTLEIDAPGIDSRARMIVRNGARAGQSNIAYSLYARATGIMSWFISEKTLRQKQEQMVDRYLKDLEKAFGAPAKS